MKVLFIGSLKFDYLQDLTYSGLAKRLGAKNIIVREINICESSHAVKLRSTSGEADGIP